MLGEPSLPDLLDRPGPHFQMCICVLHCLKKYLCVSVFPLFSFKIFFLLWKNIQRLGCFSEWLALLLLFRLRVLLGKNSGSGQLTGFSTKCISKFFFWLGGTKYNIIFSYFGNFPIFARVLTIIPDGGSKKSCFAPTFFEQKP